ncbi:hypothetical protein LTR08_006226 [Meristemomyces frigidus]|nr:hypothetical protein LTR08_006226 [Meristemomyces frigidus]
MPPNSIPNDIYQYSLLGAYNSGLKEGGPPVAFLTNHGTYGVGFFESDEDEEDEPNDMIQVESVAYTLDRDGKATPADKQDQMPFTMVCVFQPAQRVKPPAGTGSKRVKEVFDRAGKNTPMPYRITGQFKYLNTKQKTYWNVKGSVFGYWIPSWQKEMSGEALTSCFLSEDKKVGGRVLDFETGEGACLEWAKCGRFHLGFPQDPEFEQLDI